MPCQNDNQTNDLIRLHSLLYLPDLLVTGSSSLAMFHIIDCRKAGGVSSVLLNEPMMCHTPTLLMFMTILLVVTGCADVYRNPEAVRLSKTHEFIAILPPDVTNTPYNHRDSVSIRLQQESESLHLQEKMALWLMRRRGSYYVQFTVQDVKKTNAILAQARDTATSELTMAEICDLLQVDALVLADVNTHRAMSDGAAVTVRVITGRWNPTDVVNVYVELYDRRTDQVIWNFNRVESGSVLTSIDLLTDNLIYRAFENIPYSRKK